MKNLAVTTQDLAVKADTKAQKLCKKVFKKDKGGSAIIIELGLMGVAVALLLVYRTEVNTFLTTFMGQATTNLSALLTI